MVCRTHNNCRCPLFCPPILQFHVDRPLEQTMEREGLTSKLYVMFFFFSFPIWKWNEKDKLQTVDIYKFLFYSLLFHISKNEIKNKKLQICTNSLAKVKSVTTLSACVQDYFSQAWHHCLHKILKGQGLSIVKISKRKHFYIKVIKKSSKPDK